MSGNGLHVKLTINDIKHSYMDMLGREDPNVACYMSDI